MGGHAGGDVASSLAIRRLTELDQPFGSPAQQEHAIRDSLADTAAELIDTVARRPELAGMGTTVSALVMVDDYAVIGHIGDSRIYLYRDDTLTQITADHTFVQRLVDSGRITPEEARYHPRRSVLMRVLGDMDPDPEVDSFIMPTQDGDRWLLCSDGLSGVVDDAPHRQDAGPRHAPGAHGRRSAQAGARRRRSRQRDGRARRRRRPAPVFIGTPTIVGSASTPSGVVVPAARPSRSGWLHHARQVANEPTHFEPAAEFLEELIEEDRRRARRRRFGWLAALILVLAGIGVGLFAGYNWTQTLYYVGADSDSVVIYRGIQQSIGPISLSTVYQDTNIPLSELSDFDRQTVQATISAPSLNDAEKIVERLRPAAEGSG